MNNRSLKCTIIFFIAGLLFVSFPPVPSRAITLEEAISIALDGSYVVKEQSEIVERSRFSYISSIDPYLPRADIGSSYIRTISPMTPVSTFTGDTRNATGSRDAYTFTGSVSWRIFDGGERYAKRRGAFFVWEREKERFKSVREEVLFNITSSFYTALGTKSIVEKRKESLQSAEKIYNLTRARYEEGIVMKSALLQAEVRLLASRIDLTRAQKEYEKALESVKSLVFFVGPGPFDVEGELEEPAFEGDYKGLTDRALTVKPEIVAQEKEVERFSMAYKQQKSAWYPKIDGVLQQTRQDRHFFPEGRTDAFRINFTFPLFDGVGRYYNVQGAMSDINAAKHRLEETKRTTGLDIARALKDYELARQDVTLYSELVREATSNFDQLYGEYMEGKGDILGLLQGEKDLASAKEGYVSSLYKANVSLAYLKRVAYIGDR